MMNQKSNFARNPKNRLKSETSPYLLQHADNPVDWEPWGDEAFERAKRTERPVFLSIGYSTCHWCHVMARECFEDEEVAALLNERFVSVKVDREERPDIDSIYMEACQRTTGSGGWPLSLFLTPDREPFFAGTYFPKPQFLDLLQTVERLWDEDRPSLLENGRRITGALKTERKAGRAGDVVEETFRYLSETFDRDFGGFGGAPKFPMPSNLRFLLTYHSRNGEGRHAIEMVEKTLNSMARGGIFDHIGYGFSRYSTDNVWLVPHFEKMLYDNAQLVWVYLECFRLTKKEEYRVVALRCLDYVLRDLALPDGGFASAEDADSEGEEGLFYLLTAGEVKDVLGNAEGTRFCKRFGMTETGNCDGKNIPNQLERQEPTFEPFCKKLYDYRKARRSLHRDDKVLTVWNCLMISALCKAASVLNQKKYLCEAERTFAFLEKNCTEGEEVFTSWRMGRHNGNGVLDDYAFLISAGIDLFKATRKASYLEQAIARSRVVGQEFADSKGGYFLTKRSASLIVRPKETYDGVIPCGNSMMAENLLFLSYYSDEFDAAPQFAFLQQLELSGGQCRFAEAVLRRENFQKIIVVTPGPEVFESSRLDDFDFVEIRKPDDDYPLKDGRPTFYVCKGDRCLPPSHVF